MSLADYALGGPLGAGAFGETFAATRRADGLAVAVKRLRLRGLPDWKPFERFEREAKTLRALSHPGVMRFLEAFDEEVDGERLYFIVAERIAGQTLAAAIADGKRWTEAAARAVLRHLLETLHYLHTLSPRVLHRDIKPSNIMMRADDVPVLIDFGAVADLATARADGSPTVVGTAGYMPPEQAMGRPDPRSDLYAVGATMIHLLSHEHPAGLLGDDLRLQLPDTVGISETLAAIVRRLVEPDPGARFASAQAVLDALEAADGAPSDRQTALAPTTSNLPAPLVAPRPLTPQIRDTLSSARTLEPRKFAFAMGGASMLWVGALYLFRFQSVASMIGFVLFTVVFAHARFGGANKARALYRDGQRVTGRVSAAKVGAQGQTSVSYTYEVDGGVYTGKFNIRDALAMQGVERGSSLAVFYAPSHPGVSTALLPRELPAAADPNTPA